MEQLLKIHVAFHKIRLIQTTECGLFSKSCCPIAGYVECLPMSFYDTLIHFKISVKDSSCKELTAVSPVH